MVKCTDGTTLNLPTYNELSWFDCSHSAVAVLHDSNACYYRKDRVLPRADGRAIQGKKKLGGERFLVQADGPLSAMDLLTGIMTRVRGASRLSSGDEVPGHWFAGFSEGKFGIWAFTDECFRRLHRDLDEQRRQGERDEYQLGV